MTEIVTHERTGWLEDPNDGSGWDAAMRFLLHDDSRRQELAAAAQTEIHQRYDREAVISRIEALYQAQ
jgi:glycosyltransferase involved in cell wall biosynthesis